jgi:hypothetical protein
MSTRDLNHYCSCQACGLMLREIHKMVEELTPGVPECDPAWEERAQNAEEELAAMAAREASAWSLVLQAFRLYEQGAYSCALCHCLWDSHLHGCSVGEYLKAREP